MSMFYIRLVLKNCGLLVQMSECGLEPGSDHVAAAIAYMKQMARHAASLSVCFLLYSCVMFFIWHSVLMVFLLAI